MVLKNNHDKKSYCDSNAKYHFVKELVSSIRFLVAEVEEFFNKFSEEQKAELFHEIREAKTTLHLVEQWIEAQTKGNISSDNTKEKI